MTTADRHGTAQRERVGSCVGSASRKPLPLYERPHSTPDAPDVRRLPVDAGRDRLRWLCSANQTDRPVRGVDPGAVLLTGEESREGAVVPGVAAALGDIRRALRRPAPVLHGRADAPKKVIGAVVDCAPAEDAAPESTVVDHVAGCFVVPRDKDRASHQSGGSGVFVRAPETAYIGTGVRREGLLFQATFGISLGARECHS